MLELRRHISQRKYHIKKGSLTAGLMAVLLCLAIAVKGQDGGDRPDQAIKQPVSTALWNGFYGKIRLSDKLFWDAQFHYRRSGNESMDYIGRMGQIYNRHALNYLVNERFSVSLGPVLRLNFTPDPGNPAFENMVLEPRIWHEYLFAMPFSGSMAYPASV